MGGYSKHIVSKRTFDGDEITVVMKPLKFLDMLKIDGPLLDTSEASTLLKNTTDLNERKEIEQKVGDGSVKLIEVAYEILPRYVVSVEGLHAADGTKLGPDDLFESSYFTELLSKLLVELRNRSVPQDPPSPGVPSTA